MDAANFALLQDFRKKQLVVLSSVAACLPVLEEEEAAAAQPKKLKRYLNEHAIVSLNVDYNRQIIVSTNARQC